MFSHQAESELQRATMDATRTTRQLEETIDEFEKQKIRDIKVCCNFSWKYMSVETVGDHEVKPDRDFFSSFFFVRPHLLLSTEMFPLFLTP